MLLCLVELTDLFYMPVYYIVFINYVVVINNRLKKYTKFFYLFYFFNDVIKQECVTIISLRATVNIFIYALRDRPSNHGKERVGN